MSNKLKLQDHATNLQTILDTINALPEAGADAYAVIAVTYPEGSICTCSKGSETLELDNTVGYGFFLVPSDGEWTVSCTDGTNSKSQSVSITKEGQFESVTLSFQLILFDGGDNTAVTGGWDADGHGGPTVVLGNNIGLDASFSGHSGYKSWMFATNNLVDVRGYSKLHAIVKTMSGITTAQLCVTNEINTNDGEYLGVNDPVAAADASVGECVLDISSLNGSYHLGLWCESNIVSYSSYHITLLASKIWLE